MNLARFIINKMLEVLKKKEKEAQSKRNKTSQSQFAIFYVTLITHYAKILGIVSPKYEMILIAFIYNLAFIAKIGYKDKDNNGTFIKVRGAHDEDDEGEESEQAQDPTTLGQIMDVLGEIQFGIGHLNSWLNIMDECLDSLGAQVAEIDRKVSLGVSAEELHVDPTPSRSSDATQSPHHA